MTSELQADIRRLAEVYLSESGPAAWGLLLDAEEDLARASGEDAAAEYVAFALDLATME